MSSEPAEPALADLRARLSDLLLRDERRLRRRLERARAQRDPQRRRAALARLVAEVAAAEQRRDRRAACVPPVSYPPELPVSQARDELLRTLRDAQVVVVAGETGSGKTTQLPKLCLELGRGVRGMIGHTQPRRIAARSVAARIAEELEVPLGAQVGFQVRFDDETSDDTLVKVMTDGILLTEIQRDPQLLAYDTIIVDEAHERSLNIDFLLGYLARLLPRRPDLKLVITSATIDPERFSRHFGDAPVVEVSGRTYPVEVRYRPLDDDEDQVDGICRAVRELVAEGPGDVLVFCSGEREIRDAAEGLRALDLPDTEILPLYARLSSAEQQRVFSPHDGRRIVLATNIAETSLTVPGIRYVVDPGTARISRYSARTKVQRLPIEKISRASADQRKGRCGRVAAGVCIRLYSEEDFEARPAFTEPEILRTNLASVVLQMAALGIGDIEGFPFVDPPDRRSLRDAVTLLHELGAVEGVTSARERVAPTLTPIGRTLAALPIDPRLGRMLIEADRSGCLHEVLIIVSALSIQDPRERPSEQRAQADALHARFADERSDFLSYLHLWRYLRDLRRRLSGNAFRRQCRAEHLHYLRIREWQDLHAQLRRTVRDLGMTLNTAPAEPEVITRALLAGLLSHIGLRRGDTREYDGARGTRFALWPGSALAKRPPTWVVAAELVETSRLWARTVARIEPEWAEELAGHLVARSYSAPRWSRRQGAAVATERVTLFGVPLVAARTVPYARVDPQVSRELFLRHALVEGQWRTSHAFLRDNQRLLAELAELEHKARRRDVIVDDEAVYAFYDARVPEHVVSARHFDAWWKKERQRNPDLLTLTREDLLGDAADADPERGFPDVVTAGDVALRTTYRFEPGAPDDGVTVHVPLAVLPRLSPVGFDWQVPGLRADLVTALVRSLPKDLRRRLVPIPDTVRRILPRLVPDGRPLVVVLAAELQRETGVPVPADAFDLSRVPDHLRVTFRVVDGDETVATGKDLRALQQQLAPRVRARVADAADDLERRGLRTWPCPVLPRRVERRLDGHVVEGFPALVDEGDSVGVRVLASPAEQQRAMWRGTRRLLLLELPPPARAVAARLDNRAKLSLTRNPHGSVAALLEDCTSCAVAALLAEHGGPVWDARSYAALREAVAADLVDVVVEIVETVRDVLDAAQAAETRLDALPRTAALQPALDDARAHLAALVRPGFVTATGRARLADLVRYVRGIERRFDKLDPERDAARRARLAEVQAAYAALRRSLGPAAADEAVRDIWFQIEELRVSLFAQQLGTRGRVSEKRIFQAIADVEAAHHRGAAV